VSGWNPPLLRQEAELNKKGILNAGRTHTYR
jgi:hypothetical protein